MQYARKRMGFTLIELMIVVVIIGILAAIAIPRFTNKGRAAGDDATLREAVAAQQRYKQQHNRYATTPTELATVGWDSATAGNVQTLRIVAANAESYCIENTAAAGSAAGQVKHVTQGGAVEAGACMQQ